MYVAYATIAVAVACCVLVVYTIYPSMCIGHGLSQCCPQCVVVGVYEAWLAMEDNLHGCGSKSTQVIKFFTRCNPSGSLHARGAGAGSTKLPDTLMTFTE